MKQFFKRVIKKILIAFAKRILKNKKPTTIAVGGSVGKTSTKDAIFSIATPKHSRKSEGNYNTDFGLPLSIFDLKSGFNNPFIWTKNMVVAFFRSFIYAGDYPKKLVLEVGIDEPGDMQEVAEWFRPNIVCMTQMSSVPVHIENFKSVSDLENEKAYLVRALRKNGLLIINVDDERSSVFKEAASSGVEVVSIGFSDKADVRAVNVFSEITDECTGLVSGEIKTKDGEVQKVTINGVIGEHHFYPILYAFAVGLHLGVSLDELQKQTANYVSPKGRMRVYPGRNDSTIIDDTYNSSPIAMKKALDTFEKISNTKGKKIAVVGDMKELGEYAKLEHLKVMKHAYEISDTIITVGKDMAQAGRTLMKERRDYKKIKVATDSLDAAEVLKEEMTAGDTILIKGSQAMRMEKTVAVILDDPNSSDMLVRQSKEWRKS
ncbi:MAG: UDP-N-acetylmuramoyl-tripeptide--D-alanyl-D-alanine ligase [Candidatus Campbellbacteria bacterium]|nr:UDP-N-acetylmuramoyl-tripeptide--D-alanyl-D-alanine ligase [Candidatus Campbellbacteria bacterium]